MSRDASMTQEDRIIFEEAEGEDFQCLSSMILSKNDSVILLRHYDRSTRERKSTLHNLVEVECCGGAQPRVVPTSQPWAMVRNPVGIQDFT